MNNVAASLPLMLKKLRLSVFREQWESMAEKALHDQWRPEQYLSELCHIELASRTDKRCQSACNFDPLWHLKLTHP